MDEKELTGALEAILFASGDSLSAERIAQVLGVSREAVLQTGEALADEYVQRGGGIRLARMEDALQLVSAPEYSEAVTRALETRPHGKLSPTSLEVLAIVAYFQPVTRAYIEQLRGVDSSHTVTLLTERGLIAPCGRLEAPGRPTLFGTTEQFLRVMGVTTLQELPPLPDISTDEGIVKLQAAIEAASGRDEQLEIMEI